MSSSILPHCTRLTDSQTDGPIDRILIDRPRLHSIQRGKKDVFTAMVHRCQDTYIATCMPINTGRLVVCFRCYIHVYLPILKQKVKRKHKVGKGKLGFV